MWRLLKVWIILTTTVFVSVSTVLMTTRRTYRDPFAPYEALMPGQSINGLRDYPCRLRITQVKNSDFRGVDYCRFEANYGVFGEVTLNINDNIITQITASNIQPDALSLGDLVLCW